MYDHTVIEGLAQIALFLAVVSSYAYVVWAKKGHSLAVPSPPQPDQTDPYLAKLFFASQEVSRPVGPQSGGAAGRPPQGKLAAAGDWLVPVIVWFLVIMMGVAIVGFLLGDK